MEKDQKEGSKTSVHPKEGSNMSLHQKDGSKTSVNQQKDASTTSVHKKARTKISGHKKEGSKTSLHKKEGSNLSIKGKKDKAVRPGRRPKRDLVTELKDIPQNDIRLSEEWATQDKAGRVLLLLQGTTSQQGINLVDPDGKRVLIRSDVSITAGYEELPDPRSQMKNVPFLLQANKKAAWEEEENPSEEYIERKEAERLKHLRARRGRIFTWSFTFLFHACVSINFITACVDSFKLLSADAKLQALLLKGDFNCLDISRNHQFLAHVINIFQALMSSMVLYADNRVNASLCMSCVFAQALHASYKAFSFFMQMRFDEGLYFSRKITYFVFGLVTDVFAAVVTIQRFYDLTDRIRVRSSNFAVVTDGMSMNDEIIYQNQSSFLQRKHILREAISSQVYTVIKKIDNFKKKGLEVDHLELFKELYAARDALADVNNVENRNLLKELKKATARKFRDYETNPNILQEKHAALGTFSKLFAVNFGDRDNPLSTCRPANFTEDDPLPKNPSVQTLKAPATQKKPVQGNKNPPRGGKGLPKASRSNKDLTKGPRGDKDQPRGNKDLPQASRSNKDLSQAPKGNKAPPGPHPDLHSPKRKSKDPQGRSKSNRRGTQDSQGLPEPLLVTKVSSTHIRKGPVDPEGKLPSPPPPKKDV